MDKRFFGAMVMLFILIIAGIPFYWFAYRPKAVRQQCLGLSLGTAFDELDSQDSMKEKIADYFRSRGGLKKSMSSLPSEMKENALFLIMRQKESYQICLDLNGLKE